VAVVGAGPAGVYAADALTGQDAIAVRVDVLDRLPTPFGLVRYGVAPDHPKIRSVSRTLQQVLERPAVHFLGGVGLGRDVSAEELRAAYDAVVYSFGAATDRRLGIPGEDLPGSVPATEFVAWYCGHPDAPLADVTVGATKVAVVGVGNVAVDVARVLTRPAEDLLHTDIPHEVLEALTASTVTDVHVLGRRGPAQASWTTKELRELGELTGVDVLVDPRELELDAASAAQVAASKALTRNLEILRGFAARPATGARRRLHLRFLVRPVEVLGTERVQGLRVERTRLTESGLEGTGETSVLDVQLVLRSVGYLGVALPGVPFDASRGVIPNQGGRVLRDGTVSVGEYVTGWVRRGPTGVIGTNKGDAAETAAALLADAPELLRGGPDLVGGEAGEADDDEAAGDEAAGDGLLRLLAARGVRVVTLEDWARIEAAEEALGITLGRSRVKLHSHDALKAALGG